MKKNNTLAWEKTSELYTNWLVNNDIKNFFLDNLLIKDFQIWWVTDLANKDNVVENQWFYNLKKVLIDKKIIKMNKLYLYLKIFLKLLKNFLVYLFYFTLIKIFLSKKTNIKKYNNCFHSYEHSFKNNKKNKYIDRLYGVAPLKNNIKENFYLISLTYKGNFFLNFFKKIKKLDSQNVDYFISDSYLNFGDIIEVYFKSVIYLFKVIFYTKSKSFLINKKDCSNVLYPLLLNSFGGNIQSYILQSLSIKNFFNYTESKYFINYGEFYPGYKSTYFFLKKVKFPIKIITIQHSYANRNLLFFRNKKKEFLLNSKKNIISPMPDKYLVMGNHFKKILKEYFPNKIKIIGSLRYDIDYFKIDKKNKKKNKKIFKVLLCPTIGDEDSLISIINKSQIKNVSFILSPHPNTFNETLKKFKNNFNYHFIFDKNKSSIEQLKNVDITICGFSSLVLESIVLGVPAFRVISEDHPYFFDLNDGVDFANGHIEFKKKLYKVISKKQKKNENIFKNIFYNLDKKSYKRFWKNIN